MVNNIVVFDDGPINHPFMKVNDFIADLHPFEYPVGLLDCSQHFIVSCRNKIGGYRYYHRCQDQYESHAARPDSLPY